MGLRAAFKGAFNGFTKGLMVGGYSTAEGRGWTNTGNLPSAQINYARLAGPLWKNSATSICLEWVITQFKEAPLVVVKPDPKTGKEAIIPNHRLTRLVQNPNAWYGADEFWAGVLTSYYCAGNSYIVKIRGQGGLVRELWWVPHMFIRPVWPMVQDPNNPVFISHYVYDVNGAKMPIAVNDVIHIRWGLDPENPRVGFSRLFAQLRDICTDNEAATYTAAVLRNAGVPSQIFSPKTIDAGTTYAIDEEDSRILTDTYQAKTTGDRRGEPIVIPFPVDTVSLSWKPEEMALDKIRTYPEHRIAATFKVAPAVVGLNAGQGAMTYSNLDVLTHRAYYDCVIPLWKDISTQIWKSLKNDVSVRPDDEKAAFDMRFVQALQEDEFKKHQRFVLDYQGGVSTRGESREGCGYEADKSRDNVFYTDLAPQGGAEPVSNIIEKQKSLRRQIMSGTRMPALIPALIPEPSPEANGHAIVT